MLKSTIFDILRTVGSSLSPNSGMLVPQFQRVQLLDPSQSGSSQWG